jgi:two-component system alkaline phosphatase synthesis response regulator PhoP
MIYATTGADTDTSRPAAMKRTILIIEDDAQVAEMIAAMLGRHGYDTVITHDGVEAISKLMGGGADMIVLDIMMPFFSGYWYCDVFKKNPATHDIPVVIISALDKKRDIEKGLKLGADAYVTKPFTEDGLVNTIEAIFAGKGKGVRKRKRN